MKIIVDAMGGDNAPMEIVKGALAGQKHWGVDIALTGDESAIRDALLRAPRRRGDDVNPGRRRRAAR